MPKADMLERKFSMIALKKGYASKEQISRAFNEQKRLAENGKDMFIGDILVRAEVITESQKEEVLESQKELNGQLATKFTELEAVEETEKEKRKERVQSPAEEETIPDLQGAKRVQNDSGFELAITRARLQAYIYPQGENTPDVGFDVIKGLLEMERIQFGIVDEAKINEYLASKPTNDKLFKLAQGNPADPGKPTEIKYHFDTNPLKAATIREDGKIDYKNRGKIPQVKAGDLLAEIIPGTEGRPGKDIYGGTIDPPKPDIVSLSCGVCVKKSEDGFKAFAEIDGRPELLDDGTICVSDTLPIPGDVGIETGHIEFDGHIQVKGAVQQGYRVKGKTLVADEIHKAEVEMDGDIVVTKGIIGANVLTDGTVKARHIRDAKIDALGDVRVEREVYESHIDTNGTFYIERGTVMGSSISAMKGIEAAEIGSQASDPCTLIIGIDNRLEKQIAALNLQISEKEKEQAKLKADLEKIRFKLNELEKEIEKLFMEKNEYINKGVSLKETLKSFKLSNDRKNVIKVVKIIEALNSHLEKIQMKKENLLRDKEQCEQTITKYNNNINKLEGEITKIQNDIKSWVEMAKTKETSACIKATGKVYDRTSIRGRRASLVVRGTLQRVRIQETKNPDQSSSQDWLMSVSTI